MDEFFMKKAIESGARGSGKVSPNPLVGAVIVKDGRMIGTGYHEYYGGLHAERNAINNCCEPPQGGTIYVTLEPCCHYGKTPPCTEAIIESGIKRVVIGCLDPNPIIAGKGISILEMNGIEVTTGICEEECQRLAEIFLHYIKNKTPYVTMKYAMSADGKIGTYLGDSQWITGAEARTHVHLERKKNKGIMVGIGTVLADDPMLNCRSEDAVDPIRIICDSRMQIPLSSKIVKTASKISTIVAVASGSDRKREQLKKAGVEVIDCPGEDGRVSLVMVMEECTKRGIDSILLEGGSTLNAAAIRNKIVSKVQVYVGTKIIGGKDAKTPVEGQGAAYIKDCLPLIYRSVKVLGNDVLIEYDVENQEEV